MDTETMSTWRHLTSYPSPDEVIEEYLGREGTQLVFVVVLFCLFVSV